MTTLNVVGIDVTSVGQVEPRSPDELVIAAGAIVGAILIGQPQDAPAVTAAVKAGREVGTLLDALRAGRWEVLAEQ